MQTVYFKKLVEDAKIPEFMTENAVGADIHSVEDLTIEPGKWKVVPTGLAYEMPNNLEMQVRSRSGLAAKNGIFVLNGIGTCDPDFTGEIGVILANFSEVPFEIKKGDRIAQIVSCDVPLVEYKEKSEIRTTERGTGGFGSTGK